MELKKTILDGFSNHCGMNGDVGIIRETPVPLGNKQILIFLLSLGAHQNLRNDSTITITANDVEGYYTLDEVDDCISTYIEYCGYVGNRIYDVVGYYEKDEDSICVQMPYLQALYHYIALERDCDAPYANLAEIIDCIYEKVGVDNAL